MKVCYFCNETEDLSAWRHPVDGVEYTFCEYCHKSIIGVCAECNNILSRMDPVGINNDGRRICYKCSAAHDMAEDET